MNKLVILDRDGVINLDSDAFVKNADEWIPITNSITAISRLYKAGYQIAVATNQSGLGRGYFSQQDLDDMHNKNGCNWLKPKAVALLPSNTALTVLMPVVTVVSHYLDSLIRSNWNSS